MKIWSSDGKELKSREVDGQIPLVVAGLTDDCQTTGSPLLIPASGTLGVLAALIVPDGRAGTVAVNGVPLAGGMSIVQHTDRIEWSGRTVWVVAAARIEVVAYDPAVHGKDIRCFITKASLKSGEPSVRCPGHDGRCGLMYRQAAWDMALETDQKFRCPQCGFDPNSGEWKPESPQQTEGLDDLMRLVSAHRTSSRQGIAS